MKVLNNLICNECQSSRIVIDELKGEAFCLDCGLIIDDKYSMFSIVDYMIMLKLQEKQERLHLMENI